MTQLKKQAICAVCHENFGEDWVALAKHILKYKDKLHRNGRRWAHKVLTNAKRLNQKRDLKPRTALTAQEKENKKEMIRETSGDEEIVTTICPSCKQVSRARIPVEHTSYEHSWRINGKLAIFCQSCRS